MHEAYRAAAAIARRTGAPALVLTPRYGPADYAAWPVAAFHDPDRDDEADPAALAFFDVVDPPCRSGLKMRPLHWPAADPA